MIWNMLVLKLAWIGEMRSIAHYNESARCYVIENHSSKKEIKLKKNAKQKTYYAKNKEKILDSKMIYYQKNVNAIRTQQRAYFTEDAASKKCFT